MPFSANRTVMITCLDRY